MRRRLSSVPPASEVAFDRYDAQHESLTVFLHADFDPPREILVSYRRWWPKQPLVVATPESDAAEAGERGRPLWPNDLDLSVFQGARTLRRCAANRYPKPRMNFASSDMRARGARNIG